jgi:nucleoside-diphosphate-sugar epimerase
MSSLTVALLGATGNVGGHYARLALDAGHSLRALARNPAKLDPIIPNGADHPNVTAIAGDATNPNDIATLIEGADVVVSCLGNPNPSRGVHIMATAANNVLEVAAKQPEPPRCIFISSVGMGGTSWFIYKLLELVGRDKASIADYETADQRLRSETTVPVTIVRPYALNNKPSKDTYNATTKSPMHFAKPIARADVAAFLLDTTTNPKWDGPTGVQLSGG